MQKNYAIIRLYSGESGKSGFYNSQEIGLAKAFAKRHHHVIIVYPEKKADVATEKEINDQISLLRMPCKTIGTHAKYSLDFLLERKIDIVHLNSDNQLFAPEIMKFCRKHGIIVYNYVGTLYSDSNHWMKKKFMDMVSKRNIRFFKRYPTFSKTPYVQNQLLENGVETALLAPVGLDMDIIPEIKESKDEIKEKTGLPLCKKIILFVGRLEAYKRPLDIFSLLNLTPEDFYFVIIGNGSLKEEILKLIEKNSLQNRVKYIESIPNREIHYYYKASDFFVNLNSNEIFGMSILEAMYQGCIVVARHAPGPDYIIENGISGYLADSVEEMGILLKMADNRVRENAVKRICGEFSWDRTAQIIEKQIGKSEA